MDAAKEMLERAETLEEHIVWSVPFMILNHDKTDFYSFTIDDFTLTGYEPMKPQLKLELGI